MQNKFLISIFSFALILSFGSVEQVLACMCGKSETCERYNLSDAIFIGKAIAIKKETSGMFETESTVFEIQESFLGNNQKQIKVVNKFGGSCGVEFKKDETYLVFAHKYENEYFGTNFCSGDLPIEYAAEEISNLRALLKSDTNGKLFGSILGEFNQQTKAENRIPVPKVKINVQELNTQNNYTVISDELGKFELKVKAGKYKISPIAPNSTKLKFYEETEIFQVKPRGCAEGYFVLANNSRIKGKVVDAEGKPVPNLNIELLTTTQKEKSFMRGNSSDSDENGYFEFNDIPIGEYTLSVNSNHLPQTMSAFPTTFYPTTESVKNAKIFEVKLGSVFDDVTFQLLPKLVEKEFEGKVYWSDGTPAQNVDLILEDSEFDGIRAGCDLKMIVEKIPNSNAVSASGSLVGLGCEPRTDSTGKFTLSGFIGRKYRVQAEIVKEVNGKKIEFIAESELISVDEFPKDLKLVLREKSKEK